MTRRPRKTFPTKIDPAIAHFIEEAAERAAKRATSRAVKQVFLALGVNAETAEGVIESQKDAAFLRRVRVMAETRPGQLGLAAFGALLTFIGAVIVFVLNHFFGK